MSTGLRHWHLLLLGQHSSTEHNGNSILREGVDMNGHGAASFVLKARACNWCKLKPPSAHAHGSQSGSLWPGVAGGVCNLRMKSRSCLGNLSYGMKRARQSSGL